MNIAGSFLAELDVEMPTTRRLLERVPGERGDWKPHAKSFSLAHLAQRSCGRTSTISRITGGSSRCI